MKQRLEKPSSTASLRTSIRNRWSQMLAAMRRARRLQPLHRRYGPIKYRYVLPALQRLQQWFTRQPTTAIAANLAYAQWAARTERLRDDRDRALAGINRFTYRPTISILLPVYNTPTELLRKAIESVLQQFYADWELCISDDASTARHVRELLDEYRARDARIKVTFAERNGGIAEASNRALALATGEFIGLLDHDDQLTPDALYEIAATLQKTDADLIYSDEDRLDAKGRRTEARFKPAWSPDLLLSCMYLAHFCVYRKSIVNQLGGFRGGFDGSQDYDLALRVTEATEKIAHIPKILYHWRKVAASASSPFAARPTVTEAGRRALQEALDRRQIIGEVASETVYGYYRVRRAITRAGRVSIIIPTRDGIKHLPRCIASIEAKTDYRNFDILVVDNGSRHRATLDYLQRLPYRVLRLDEPFNFSRLNNVAARETIGEHLLFLNDDTEVINAEWLTAMVEQAERAEVGAVGAKLLYPDGRIQHAGIILGAGGAASHAHRGVDGFSGAGYLNYPNVIRNYNAVTAACLMMRRAVFFGTGGFDENRFAVSYNDVDLCLRLRRAGYLIVYTPYAQLYHHESATRGTNRYPHEEANLRAGWRNELLSDCYYNPNLRATGDFTIDYAKPESLLCAFAQESDEQIISRLDSATRVGQEFVIEHDNLCAIALRLQLTHRTDQGVLRLRVRESPASAIDLAIAELAAAQVRDGQWGCFYFNPLRNSGGRRYYFCLEMSAASAASAVKVWGSTNTAAEAGPHFQNHVAAPGTLAFRVYTLLQFRYAAFSAAPQATSPR